MSSVEVTGLPEDTTIVQGYFVWSGFDEEGRRISGAVEYPFNEEGFENHDFDPMKIIGLLDFFKMKLMERESEGFVGGEEDG